MLGPGPLQDIEAAVGIDARLAHNPVPMYRGKLIVRPQELREFRGDSLTPARILDDRASIEVAERERETDKIGDRIRQAR